jgi:hypothetical protein
MALVSERGVPSAAAPYTLQLEANTKCFTPASAAARATDRLAWQLIWSVTVSKRLPIASLDTAARWTTASKPVRSCAVRSRTSRNHCSSSTTSGRPRLSDRQWANQPRSTPTSQACGKRWRRWRARTGPM